MAGKAARLPKLLESDYQYVCVLPPSLRSRSRYRSDGRLLQKTDSEKEANDTTIPE